MRAIALIGAAPLPGQIDCPGQILQIRDCPGDSGTVGAYETSALCAKSWTLIACPQRAPVIYCIYVRVFGPAGGPALRANVKPASVGATAPGSEKAWLCSAALYSRNECA